MMTQIGKITLFLIFLFLASCSPSSLADVRCEGEAETRKLAHELRGIENKDELQRAVPKVKKRFSKIAEILVETRKFPLDR